MTTTYFVTGATGFIGRRVLERLLADDDNRVIALVRSASLPAFAGLLEDIGHADSGAVRTVVGDLTEDGLGLLSTGSRSGEPADSRSGESADSRSGEATDAESGERIDHVVHLGAIYDLTVGDAQQRGPNVDGTRRVAEFAAAHDAMMHHVSSIAVAGDFDGVFTENDFDRGQGFPTAYHQTKFEAEKAVRETPGLRWRVYRPSAVVGDSATGEMDKLDGPYFFFGLLSEFRKLPSFLRLPMPDLGRVNMVPVDFVADALVALAVHRPEVSDLVFHLSDPVHRTTTDLFNALAPAYGAPRGFDAVPSALVRPLVDATGHGPVRYGRDLIVEQLGIPPVMLDVVSLPVDFRADTTTRVLGSLGVTLPDFDGYVPRLWTYWREHLNPARYRRRDPRGPLVGKNIVITGGSSGIGKATARMCVERGANVMLVARDAEKLAETVDELSGETPKDGLPLGAAYAYPADLADESAAQTLVKAIIAEHDHIDVLVNNAGRSIRRATVNSVDRAHDYRRVMAINYFGAVDLTLAVLPHMIERQCGHIVNVSSMAVQSRGARFAAYTASKAALEAFADVTAAETLSDHVTFSNVRLPLVRTPMIAPTGGYNRASGVWSADKAASRVLRAIVKRPHRVSTALGDIAELGHRFTPRLTTRAVHQEYLLFGESAASLGTSKA
ncbi:MAG: SDR family oxidoreductase [Gordonia sp. (in: high G+C Gram-positive bacteria)]|uniref:SDR family oxidoreductase n=1 Tax=Gordonia sp. (in: high G+C Gram-positive bacteria) TaxID=84139 RepID=UPI0039E38B4C